MEGIVPEFFFMKISPIKLDASFLWEVECIQEFQKRAFSRTVCPNQCNASGAVEFHFRNIDCRELVQVCKFNIRQPVQCAHNDFPHKSVSTEAETKKHNHSQSRVPVLNSVSS